MRLVLAHIRAKKAHECAAQLHEQAARFFEEHGELELAVIERNLASEDLKAAEVERERARLRRDSLRSPSHESAGERGG